MINLLDEKCMLSAFSVRVDYWDHLGCNDFVQHWMILLENLSQQLMRCFHLCLNNNQVHFIYLFWNRFCPASCRSIAASYQTGTQVWSTSSWKEAIGSVSGTQRSSVLQVDVGWAFCSWRSCVYTWLFESWDTQFCVELQAEFRLLFLLAKEMDSGVYNLGFLWEVGWLFIFLNQVEYITSKAVLFGYYTHLLETALFVFGGSGVFDVHWSSGWS